MPHQKKVLGWRLFFTGVLELQRLYTLVLNLDSTKFVAFESFWDLDYQINLLNSIRRSLKVKMIEARTSRHC